jgi:hypothetical protein
MRKFQPGDNFFNVENSSDGSSKIVQKICKKNQNGVSFCLHITGMHIIKLHHTRNTDVACKFITSVVKIVYIEL